MNHRRPKQNGCPANGVKPMQFGHPDVPVTIWDGSHVVARRQIKAYCRVVAREFRPKKIILFGSYAYGKPALDSDVDLAVVIPFRGRDIRMMGKIRERVGAPFPMDLLVWSPARAQDGLLHTRSADARQSDV